MLFASGDRHQYRRSPLVEVVCQLHFPTILRIGAEEPVDFQESIRQQFPHYSTHQGRAPLKIHNYGTTNPQLAPATPLRVHQFVSTDHRWKLNLTQETFTFSTIAYTNWEDFARQLDRVLVDFLQVYQPAAFKLATLRYMNAFYRPALGLEEESWARLIQPHLLGFLADESLDDTKIKQPQVKGAVVLEDNCELVLRAGLGHLPGRRNHTQPSFLLDSTLLLKQETTPAQLPNGLDLMHQYAVRLFNGALKQPLVEALEPLN